MVVRIFGFVILLLPFFKKRSSSSSLRSSLLVITLFGISGHALHLFNSSGADDSLESSNGQRRGDFIGVHLAISVVYYMYS
jgi:hypothetical protein